MEVTKGGRWLRPGVVAEKGRKGETTGHLWNIETTE